MSQLAEQVVRYDLDDLDVCWLQRVNEEREEIGKARIFLLVDLRDFFSDLEEEDRGKKSLKLTS